MKKVRRTAYLNEKDWERFREKYPNTSQRIRELILLDLQGKLDNVSKSWMGKVGR